MMNHQQFRNALEQICSPLSYTLAEPAYHFITPAQHTDEPYQLEFRVGTLKQVADIHLINSGQLLHARVDAIQTVICNDHGEIVACFSDITKATLLGD